MSISYEIWGRFGNNLFQYFACKVIANYTNKNYIYRKQFFDSNDLTIITDDNFIEIYENLRKNNNVINGNISLRGYFQRTDWFLQEKKYISSLLTEDNKDRFNDQYTIKDIVDVLKDGINYLNDKTLTVHIRLDDFYHSGYDSEISEPDLLKDYILNIMKDYDKCIFIVDKLREKWEYDYMDILLSIPNSTIKNNDILTDFSILYHSPNLMLSKSTFSWISCLCSTYNKNVWYPILNGRIPHQYIHKFKDNDVGFSLPIMTKKPDDK